MCDTKVRIYLYSLRFGICACAGGHVSLGFSVVGVFMRVFGVSFFSRPATSTVSFCFYIHVSVVFFNLFHLERYRIRLPDPPVSGCQELVQ